MQSQGDGLDVAGHVDRHLHHPHGHHACLAEGDVAGHQFEIAAPTDFVAAEVKGQHGLLQRLHQRR